MLVKFSYNSISFEARKKPKTCAKHKELAMRFKQEGLTVSDIQKAEKKFPQINNSYPYTIERNIREFVNLHKDDGLTIEEHLNAAKKCPSLFASKPETLSENISILYNFVKKYGVTKQDIIKIQNRNPVLRAMSPYTLIKNLREIPKAYKDKGLTKKEYIPMALSDYYLLGVTPERFKNNEETIVKHFSGEKMTTKDFITLFKKQHIAITGKPQTIINRLELWKYIETNKMIDEKIQKTLREIFESVLRKNISHTEEADLMYLLRCKLNTFHGTKFNAKKFKPQIAEFLLKNSNKTFEIPALDGSFAEQFNKVISDFSKQVIGKNVFKIVKK